jgi:hypothetical protein
MSTYTVHEPPPRHDAGNPDPVSYVFVRDGFSFWAFLLGPLWMLWHRLWLVLIGYLLAAASLQLALAAVGAPFAVRLTVAVLLALLVGFEAPTLRRFTLARRRWRNVGVVIGDDLESAEHRFFDTWVGQARAGEPREARMPARRAFAAPQGAGGSPLAVTMPSMRDPSTDVIGLFPEPGARR